MSARVTGYLTALAPALALAGLLASATPGLAQNTISLETNQQFEWDAEHDGTTFVWNDLAMTLTLVHPEPDADWIESADLAVTGDAFAPFTLSIEAGLDGFGQIGVFEIDTLGGASVVFGAYTGGAHCCMAIETAWLGSDTPDVTELGAFDGGPIAPLDIDQDGTVELVTQDDRFDYTFASHAASFPPVLILKTRSGDVLDVTGESAYRAAIGKDYEAMSAFCGGAEGWYAGACAGRLANAARLGLYSEARAELAAFVDGGGVFDRGWDDFSFCNDDACVTQTEFGDLLSAIDHALARWGYLPTG